MYTSVASTIHSGMYESVDKTSLHSVASTTQESTLSVQSDPVQVAVLTGRQELRLKIKMSDNVPGPKVRLVCLICACFVRATSRENLSLGFPTR